MLQTLTMTDSTDTQLTIALLSYQAKRAALLIEQMQEKQTILKHQLKGTFWMQKHQVTRVLDLT